MRMLVTGASGQLGAYLLRYAPECQLTAWSGKTSGSFHGIADFLQRLESLPSAIWIPSVNLKPEGETGQTLQCELTLSIFSDATDIAD
jgi:hypothetical protein